MTNNILIDGWNLAWKIPEISHHIPGNLEKARSLLNMKLKNYYQGKKVSFKIIYDGKPGIINSSGTNQGVDVRFSSDPEKADHLIIKYLQREKNPGNWTVITSDRELSMRVKNTGARVMSSEHLINRVQTKSSKESDPAEKRDQTLSKSEMDYWLKIFKE